jgi:mono/diheme cytochrome c family protein
MRSGFRARAWTIGLLAGLCFLFGFGRIKKAYDWTPQTPLSAVYNALGIAYQQHGLDPSALDSLQLQRGRQIVLHGRAETTPEGGRGQWVSKFYNCNSCHNLVFEEPQANNTSPEARLAYAEKHGLPFLQGTMLYGAVNRTSWYNGDYEEKYGTLVEEARHSLRASIQLCATQCAQGRRLKDWEMEAVVAFLWSRQLTLGNLGFDTADVRQLAQTARISQQPDTLKTWLEAHYTTASPATFAKPPTSLREGYIFAGDPEKGKAIYTLGCRHCHRPGEVSQYILDFSPLTFRQLLRRMDENRQTSFYHSIRYGTKPVPGHRPYMPNYTLERMSHRQVEHLRAYFEREADM